MIKIDQPKRKMTEAEAALVITRWSKSILIKKHFGYDKKKTRAFSIIQKWMNRQIIRRKSSVHGLKTF